MSTGTRDFIPDPDTRKPLKYYIDIDDDKERYIEWMRDYLGVELTPPQEKMVEAFCRNQRTLIVGANGFGKTYFIASLSLAFLYTNFPAVVLATSGTFGKMKRTYCEPIREFHENTWGLPGTYLKGEVRIRMDGYPNHYWQAATPSDPGELEGVHSDYLLGVIEEADKRAVGEDIFDSMSSLLTDRRDKVIATANPPQEAGDIVNDLMDDKTWETVRFSSFDAHNVQVEINHDSPYKHDSHGRLALEDGWPLLKKEVEDEMVDGIVRLRQIKEDWEAWNHTEWPGLEEAMTSGERDDLDVRWYRRRLGQKPPEMAVVHRPYTVDDITNAFDRDPALQTATPQGLGFDVARGTGDYNCLVGIFGREIRVLDRWHLDGATTHVDSEEHVRDLMEGSWSCPMAIDAVGEGSGIADMVNEWYPHVIRFNNGSNAEQSEKYDNKWAESNAIFGQVIRDGAGFTDSRLREEALAGGRTLEFDESYRRGSGHDVLKVTSKKRLKQALGRSPDVLDASLMAVWAASDETSTGPKTIPSTW